MDKIHIVSLLLMLFAACSTSPEVEIPEEVAELENLTVIPSDSEPSQTIGFTRDMVYGDTDDVLVGRIAGVAVDSEGRVFVADGDQNHIHVYESDADYLTRLGNEGEGPGEFGNISSLKADEKYLYAFDRNQRRINVFSLEALEFSHSIPLLREDLDIEELAGRYPGQYYLRNDGKLIVGYSQFFQMDDLEDDRQTLYYLVDQEGQVEGERFFEQKAADVLTDRNGNSFMVMYIDFGRRPLLSVGADDKLYSAWSEDFLIKVYNADGKYERALYYPYSKSELDKSEVVKEYEGERLRRMIRNADLPETWPALHSLMVDDKNRIWASTFTDSPDKYQWWVIDKDGTLYARFDWPRERSLVKVLDGYIYARETDKETGLEQVARYRIEL